MAGRLAERFGRVSAPIVTSRAGDWWFKRLAPKLDPPLLKLTRGRLSMELGTPILLLQTKGARSGQLRENPLMFHSDGQRLVVIGTMAGSPKHPAWYHNLRVHPDVDVIAPRRSGRYRAREAEGDERERLWQLAVRTNRSYEIYAARTNGRRVPVIVLEPLPS